MNNKHIVDKIKETQSLITAAKKGYYASRFYEFNRDILKWPDIYEPLHRRVCNFVQDNIKEKKLLILLPRGTFKSSIITIGYTLWRIAQNPDQRSLIANATYPMAVQFLGQIKNHLSQNETYRTVFGDLTSAADSWSESKIAVARPGGGLHHKEPTVWAQGITSNITGSHYNFAVLDDVVARENIGTKDQIEKVKNFYKDSLDLVDANLGGHKEICIIGTTWHWGDLYAWIQDPKNGIIDDFKVLRLPAYEGEWGKGKLLFPARLGWKQMRELKRSQGNYHFSAQYMLNPVPEEDQVFKPPFKHFEETDLKGVELNKFITIDPAISEKKDADYTAMVCVGVDKNNDWYILDLFRARVQPKRLIEQIFYWDDKWKPVSIGIETVAFQKALQYWIYDEMKRRNHTFPLKELGNTDRSKVERIKGLQPRYEMGSILHNPTLEYTEYLEDELQRFPRSQNDDLTDALASMLELAFPPKAKERRDKSRRRASYPA